MQKSAGDHPREKHDGRVNVSIECADADGDPHGYSGGHLVHVEGGEDGGEAEEKSPGGNDIDKSLVDDRGCQRGVDSERSIQTGRPAW